MQCRNIWTFRLAWGLPCWGKRPGTRRRRGRGPSERPGLRSFISAQLRRPTDSKKSPQDYDGSSFASRLAFHGASLLAKFEEEAEMTQKLVAKPSRSAITGLLWQLGLARRLSRCPDVGRSEGWPRRTGRHGSDLVQGLSVCLFLPDHAASKPIL